MIQAQEFHPDHGRMTKKRSQLFRNLRKKANRAKNLEYIYKLLLWFGDLQKNREFQENWADEILI